MPTKALCPKCGNALVVTAEGTLRQHGSCGKVPVEKAAGTVEVASRARAATKTAPKKTVKRAPAKKATPAKKKATARRK